jgi:hypothetical protein
MSARKPRRKQGGKDTFRDRYIALPWPMVSSAAFRALSSDAVWLLVQLKHQFKYAQGGDAHLILPYGDAAYHFSFGRFTRARVELEALGFIRIVERGGLYRKPTIYAASNGWEAKSKELERDEVAGRLVRRRLARGVEWPDGDPRNSGWEWRPTKAASPGRLANLQRANAAKKAPGLFVSEGRKHPTKKALVAAALPPKPAPPPAPRPQTPQARPPGRKPRARGLNSKGELSLRALREYAERHRQGEDAGALVAEIRAQGVGAEGVPRYLLEAARAAKVQ